MREPDTDGKTFADMDVHCLISASKKDWMSTSKGVQPAVQLSAPSCQPQLQTASSPQVTSFL